MHSKGRIEVRSTDRYEENWKSVRRTLIYNSRVALDGVPSRHVRLLPDVLRSLGWGRPQVEASSTTVDAVVLTHRLAKEKNKS